MTDCERLSERMPEVALGRARWSAADEAHLAACTECRAEWELVRAAQRLAAGAPPLPDEAAIAAAVLRRLREPAGRRAWGRPAAVAAAAAIALAVWTGAGPDGQPRGTTTVETGAAGLDPVEVAELDSLLGETAQPVAGWYMLDSPTLGELSEEELERVLVTLEG